jgi:hypothetical protein
MSDKVRPWEELLAQSKLSREEVAKAVVTVLALVHTLKEGAAPSAAKPITSDLLFDLATLHTQTVAKLAEVSAKHTGAVVGALNERRAKRTEGAAGPVLRVLVSPKMTPGTDADATFVVRNEASAERGYPLPDVLGLDRVPEPGEGGADCVFVRVLFTDAKGSALTAPLDCALPFQVRVPSKSSTTVRLKIPADERLRRGRYRGVVPLEAPGAPSAELIIELQVAGAPSEGGSPPAARPEAHG